MFNMTFQSVTIIHNFSIIRLSLHAKLVASFSSSTRIRYSNCDRFTFQRGGVSSRRNAFEKGEVETIRTHIPHILKMSLRRKHFPPFPIRLRVNSSSIP